MQTIGRFLIIVGICIVLMGTLFIVFSRLKVPFLGKLPGDILIERKNFVFYFPITTCLLVSAFLSLVVYLFFRR